jgi:hypothetical protein
MNNSSAEALKIVVSRLQNKVESIMFKVNALLSKADKDGNTLDSLESLMFDLSYNNNALEQAKNLYNQALSQLIQERAELIKQKIKPPHQEPVVEVENIPNEEEE